jgi:ribosomal protein S12 methylthiotransferase
MNRKGSICDFPALFERIRERVPGVTLRTTLMVGFPGEGDGDFHALLDFLELARPDRVAAFAYSREEGTAAAALAGQVPDDVRMERLNALRDAADRIAEHAGRMRLGSRIPCLVEAVDEDGSLLARGQFQAPDIDGCVSIRGDSSLVGEFIDVRLDASFGYDFAGSIRDGGSRG